MAFNSNTQEFLNIQVIFFCIYGGLVISMNILFFIFLVLSILVGALAVWMTVGQINLSKKFTGKTTGTVTSWDCDDDIFSLHIMFPVITFKVNGKEYKTNIPFSRAKEIKDPRDFHGQFTESGKLKDICYYGNGVDRDEFYTKYSRGTEVEVFYDPNDPDTSYAVRSVHDPVLITVWLITAFNIAMTLLFYYLWMK